MRLVLAVGAASCSWLRCDCQEIPERKLDFSIDKVLKTFFITNKSSSYIIITKISPFLANRFYFCTFSSVVVRFVEKLAWLTCTISPLCIINKKLTNFTQSLVKKVKRFLKMNCVSWRTWRTRHVFGLPIDEVVSSLALFSDTFSIYWFLFVT